ncbi:MAG: lamin tail domain-containing protein, partial [Sediminibacterium sp.]
APVSSLTWGALSPGQSAGCSTDGSPNIITFNPATPINSNSLIFITPEAVVINEVMADNTLTFIDNFAQFEDWVEIYNPLGHAVNLGGYFMSDNSNNPRKWQIPSVFTDSVTIQPYSWLTFFADGKVSQGVRHCDFNLDNNTEFVGLYSPDGLTRVDEIIWEHMGADSSLGRHTDGNSEWINFIVTTPDFSNNLGVISVQEMNASKKYFSVYPNPTRGIVQCSKKSNIRVYSIQGNLVETLYGVWQIDFSNYGAGIYVLTDEEGNKLRIIKE